MSFSAIEHNSYCFPWEWTFPGRKASRTFCLLSSCCNQQEIPPLFPCRHSLQRFSGLYRFILVLWCTIYDPLRQHAVAYIEIASVVFDMTNITYITNLYGVITQTSLIFSPSRLVKFFLSYAEVGRRQTALGSACILKIHLVWLLNATWATCYVSIALWSFVSVLSPHPLMGCQKYWQLYIKTNYSIPI